MTLTRSIHKTLENDVMPKSQASSDISNAAPMHVQVSGKQVDVGLALRTRITDDLIAGIGKYFERGGDADVVVGRDGYGFCVDVVVRLASGLRLTAKGEGGDAPSAFAAALDRIETRIRRYKRRLKNHHPHLGGPRGPLETAPLVVLRADEEGDFDAAWEEETEADSGPPAALIIAESQSQIKTLPVSMAVMELDLTDAPLVLFRNAGHGGLSVVYRRADGNIGWIDPERTAGALQPKLAAGAR
jgi:ribosomal subunit interface protein